MQPSFSGLFVIWAYSAQYRQLSPSHVFPETLTSPHNFTTRSNHTQFGNVDLDNGTLRQYTQLRV